MIVIREIQFLPLFSTKFLARMTSLAALLESSARLSKTQQGPSQSRQEVQLPSIQLGFDQLVTQSRRILDRSQRPSDSDAYFLLASAGVNPQQHERNLTNINLANTFEPLLPISDTDVEVRVLRIRNHSPI